MADRAIEVKRLERAVLQETEKRKKTDELLKFKEEEILQVCSERDHLESSLEELELKLIEIQSNVRVLSDDKDSLSHLYEQTISELDAFKKAHSDCTKTSASANDAISRLSKERDSVTRELQLSTNENLI